MGPRLNRTLLSTAGKLGDRMSRNLVINILIMMLVHSIACNLLTQEDKDKILDKHNELRRKECSSNMRLLTWDSTLEEQANAYAKECTTQHQPYAERNEAGENIAVNTQEDKFLARIEAGWYDKEKKLFCFGEINGENFNKVGHYALMVWAETSLIGCAWRKCDSIPNFHDGTSYMGVCRYKTAGPVGGQVPYKIGKACDECADGEKCCQGLCAKKDTECEEGTGVCKCEEPGADVKPCEGDLYKEGGIRQCPSGNGDPGTNEGDDQQGGTGEDGTDNGGTEEDGNGGDGTEETVTEEGVTDEDIAEGDDPDNDEDPKEGSGTRGMIGVRRNLMILSMASLVVTIVIIE